MKKINLAISGCMGRMGQQIIKSAKSDKSFNIVTLTENRKIKKKINGIDLSLNSEKSLKKADLIIDFTTPKCTFEILKISAKLKKKNSYRYDWIYKKRGKFNQNIFQKNTDFESREYELRNKFINVLN